MDDKKLQKLQDLFALVEGSISKEEFVDAFKIVVKLVRDLEKNNEEEFRLMHRAVDSFSAKLKEEKEMDVEEMKSQVGMALGGQIEAIEKKLKTVKDGKKGDRGEPGKSIEGRPGKDGSPDTGNQIVEKINGASKLIDKSAIRGLEDLEKKLNETPKQGGTFFGPSRGVFLYVDGVKKGLVSNVNLKPGSGVSISHSKVNGQDTITIDASGAGITVETPTGTVNAVNAIFGVSAEPKYMVADGVQYFAGAGYTYSAPNITFDVPPSAFVRAII